MFIVIDGPNGSGKTTLIKRLKNAGHKTLSSPNGTPLAKILRPACRGTEPWTDIEPRIQFLLFSAARLDEYIRLVMGQDKTVFADRWWTSTYVYQCMLQGISVDFLQETIHPEEKIDLVILLDAKNEILSERVLSERESNPKHGTCSWTQDMETVHKLAGLYRKELRDYLCNQHIWNITIDTSNMTTKDVFESTFEILEDIKQGVV